MRKLGLPVVVDGRWGPRSSASWQRLGLPPDHNDRLFAAQAAIARQSAITRGVAQELKYGLQKSSPAMALASARQLVKSNRSPGERSLGATLYRHTPQAKRRAGESWAQAITRTAKERQQQIGVDAFQDRVNEVVPGTYGRRGDPLMLAKLAANNVDPAGYASLHGADLNRLLNDDPDGRFTTAVRVGDHVFRVPGKLWITVAQQYANRHGEHLRVDGVDDARTHDAVQRAAKREQHADEMVAFADISKRLTETSAFVQAQTDLGIHMTFGEAWREARDKGSWAATQLLATALRKAGENYPELQYQHMLEASLKAASIFSSGQGHTSSGMPGNQEVSPFAGTPYGVKMSDPGVYQALLGVPQVLAFSPHLRDYDAYAEYLRTQQESYQALENYVNGTPEADRIEFAHYSERVQARDNDGNLRYTTGKDGHVVPLMVLRTWVDTTDFRLHKAAGGDPRAGLGYYATGGPLWDPIHSSLMRLGEPAEWVTVRGVAAVMAAGDQLTMHGFGAIRTSMEGGHIDAGSSAYVKEGQAWFDAQPFLTQFLLTAVLDPLNLFGKFAEGAGLLGKGIGRWGLHHAQDSAFLVRLGDGLRYRAATEVPQLERSGAHLTGAIAPEATSSRILGQVRKQKAGRDAQFEHRQVAQATGYRGVRAVSDKLRSSIDRALRDVSQRSRLRAGNTGVAVARKHGMDFFDDLGQTELNALGRAEEAVRFNRAKSYMHKMLLDHLPVELDRSKVPQYVFDMTEGSLHPAVGKQVAIISSQFRAVILEEMKADSRALRQEGDFQFAAHPTRALSDGTPRMMFVGPRLNEVPEASAYYRQLDAELRGEWEDVPNPGFAVPLSPEQVDRAIDVPELRASNQALAGYGDKQRRLGLDVDETERERIAQRASENARAAQRAKFRRVGAATREQAREIRDALDQDIVISQDAALAASRNGDIALRELMRVQDDLGKIAELADSGVADHLRQAVERQRAKGRLLGATAPSDEAAAELFGDIGVDEAMVRRTREVITRTTGKFDPRIAREHFGTKQMLQRLVDAIEAGSPRLEFEWDARIFQDRVGGFLKKTLHGEVKWKEIHWPSRKGGYDGGPRSEPSKQLIHAPNPQSAMSSYVLLHELGHVLSGHLARGTAVDVAINELRANLFALHTFKNLFPEASDEVMAVVRGWGAAQWAQSVFNRVTTPEDWDQLMEHIASKLSGDDRSEAEWLMQWIAVRRAENPDAELPLASYTQRLNEKLFTRMKAGEDAAAAALDGARPDVVPDDVMEEDFRRVLADGFSSGFAERGLYVHESTIDRFVRSVVGAGGEIRHQDKIMESVRRLRYQHPAVRDAYDLMRAARARSINVARRYSWQIEHMAGDLTDAHVIAAEVEAAKDAEQFAADRLFGTLLRLADKAQLQYMHAESVAEMQRLSSKRSASYAERMAHIIHRQTAKSLQGLIADGSRDVAEANQVRRAIDMLYREGQQLRREVREHAEAFDRNWSRNVDLRQRRDEFTGAQDHQLYDTRPTIRVRRSPERVSAANEKLYDAHDALAFADHDAIHTARDRPSFDITDPKNLRDDVYVERSGFKVDEAGIHHYDGKVYDTQLMAKGADVPDGAIPVGSLSSGQVQVLYQAGHTPAQFLRDGLRRAFMGEQLQKPSAIVDAARFVNGELRVVKAPTSELQRSVPQELREALTNDLMSQLDAAAGQGAETFRYDSQLVEDLAEKNPYYAAAMHAYVANRQQAITRRAYREANNAADRAYLPKALARQGMYAAALAHSQTRTGQVAYAAIDGSLLVWKTATLPLSTVWLVANVVDNVAKLLISGLMRPEDFIVKLAHGAVRTGAALAHYSVLAVSLAARGMDEIFGTDVARRLDGLLRGVTDVHRHVIEAFYTAHGVEYPKAVVDGGLWTSVRAGISREGQKWDPLDWKGPWQHFQATGELRSLFHAFSGTAWHLMGEMPEVAARKAGYNSLYTRKLAELERTHPHLEDWEREVQAMSYAIERVNHALFDYNDIYTAEENLTFLAPFIIYWRKNLAYWAKEIPAHPWLVSNLQRMETYHENPNLDHGKDPLARYFDVTWAVDPFFDALGFKPYGPDGVAIDFVKLSSIKVVYGLMFSAQNPALPPNQGGIELVNRLLGYFDSVGLGVNPYLRAGLQATDVYRAETWRTIFPQTSIAESVTREWWHDRFPDGLNVERMLLDPVYERFHDGKSLTELRQADIDYLVNYEIARQQGAGMPLDRAKAESDVRGFLGAAALVQMVAGVYLRRMSPYDERLMEIAMASYADFDTLNPEERAANVIFRERAKGMEAMRRAEIAMPYVEAYYHAAGFQAQQEILHQHPEIAAYVQRTRLRQEFANSDLQQADQLRRTRDAALGVQAGLVSKLYADLKLAHLSSDQRSNLYNAMLTPDLKDYLVRHSTPQSRADAFVRGEFYHYMAKLSGAFHDIPKTDYARRDEYLKRNPELQDYWAATNPPVEAGLAILNAANAAYREWYFAVKDAEGWDAANELLVAHPTMFDFTKASNHVDRFTGQWLPKDVASITEHARDYKKMKPTLEGYFNAAPGKARTAFLALHPELLGYFKKYGADRQFRRRHFRHHGSAGASAPWARVRAEFWHKFFQASPDRRLQLLDDAPAEVFNWGPTADSAFTAKAHVFAWGKTPRRAAWQQIAAIAQEFFALKSKDDQRFFLELNPELQAYFDQFSTKSLTGDAKLDKVVAHFFSLPPSMRDSYAAAHPELQKWFKSKRDTPEEKALGRLLDAYFGLPFGEKRDHYLLTHPELQGFFDQRKAQHDLENTWNQHLVDRDPRVVKFRHSVDYLEARSQILLRRAALYAQKGGRAVKLLKPEERVPDDTLSRRDRAPTS